MTAVHIEEFREPQGERQITSIRASLIVEKENQKAMVIGKHGSRIKEIGMKARGRLEELVGTKIFLDLFVRVEKNWTKDAEKIREFSGQ